MNKDNLNFISGFRYLVEFGKLLGWPVIFIIFLSFMASLVEAVGLLGVLPVILGEVPSEIGFLNSLLQGLSFTTVLFLFFLIFIVKSFFYFASLAMIAIYKGRLLYKLKSELFNAYTFARYKDLDKSVGYFSNIIGEQATKSLQAFNFLIEMTSQFFGAFVYLVAGFLASYQVGLLLLFAGTLVIFGFNRLNLYAKSLSDKTVLAHKLLADGVIRIFHGFGFLRSTGRLRVVARSVKELIEQLTKLQIQQGVASSFTAAIREPIIISLFTIALFIHVEVQDGEVATIIVSLVLFYRGFNSFHAVQNNSQRAFEFISSFELVLRDTKKFQKNPESFGNCVPQGGEEITFKNVHFSYTDPVLKGLTLSIKPEKCSAFVGLSGSGKSTCIKMIPGLLMPDSGLVMVGDLALENLDLSLWRENIGYVDQSSWLGGGTIIENLSLEAVTPDNHIKVENQVSNMLVSVGLGEWVEKLSKGLDTDIGDLGGNLSGGQRQRFCLARELLKKPKLLLLDEATSSLDGESERKVVELLKANQGITSVIISHRISTFCAADYIYVFEDGRVIEHGRPMDLKADQNSKLYNLYFKDGVNV